LNVRARWIAVVAATVVLVGYAIWRLFIHAGGLEPALITPSMDAHEAVSLDLRGRFERLVRERDNSDRSGRPKLIALTFDDGPYPVFTPLLLQELQALHVPATFFLIGRDAQQWPELTKRIAVAGNEVADHTLTHPDLDRETDAQVRTEILRGRDALWALVGDPAIRTMMRPPHGRYTEATVRVAQQLGYSVILWNDDSGDWRTLTPASIAEHVTDHATAPDIVLLHSGKLATVQAMPTVVARFRRAGYQFVTVGQLLAKVPVEQINHPARRRV
jgi:peptidoglycan/xylan/chitin deacetylase (PgdA/CDA1 family)